MAQLEQINASTWRFVHGPHTEVEVGDVTSSDFLPHAKVKKWGGEAYLSILYPSALKRSATVVDGVITWSIPLLDVRFYTFDPDAEHEEGKFEYEIILKQKPTTNTISLDIETNGLRFAYQSPLTQYEIDKGNIRPDNVVGSYAVYHNTISKVHLVPGDAEKYKTGKAFHIYRPELIDALGVRTWASIDINTTTGKMTITVDQSYLDNATYPVTVDPTIGNTSTGASTDSTGQWIVASRYSSGANSGDANPGTMYIRAKSSSGSGTMYGAVYEDNSLSVLSADKVSSGTDASFSVTTTEQWYSSAITWLSITSSTWYWLSVGSFGNGQLKYDSGTDSDSNSGYTPPNMPSVWPASSSYASNNDFSFYVDWTNDVGETVPDVVAYATRKIL